MTVQPVPRKNMNNFLVTVKKASTDEVTTAIFGNMAQNKWNDVHDALMGLQSKGKVGKISPKDSGIWATTQSKAGAREPAGNCALRDRV